MAHAVAGKVFPGGVLLWSLGDRVLYHKGFGVTDAAGSRGVGPDTVYDLASLTKPLATALAVADLIKKGRVTVDTRLEEVVPETVGSSKARVTLDMLLRHTSGMPAHRPFFRQMAGQGRRQAQKTLRRLLIDEPFASEPGEEECYSDLGYMMLSWVVETVSGRELDLYTEETIYRPLGIKTLGFVPLDRSVPQWCRQAAPTMNCPWRNKVMRAEVEDENAWAAGGVEGHAGLFGTAAAVHRLCCEIMNSLQGGGTGLLDTAVMSAFIRRHPGRTRVAGFDAPSGETPAAGQNATPWTIGHLGFTGTSFWMDPASGLITILLTNRVHPSRENLRIRKFRPRIHDLVLKAFKRIIPL